MTLFNEAYQSIELHVALVGAKCPYPDINYSHLQAEDDSPPKLWSQ